MSFPAVPRLGSLQLIAGLCLLLPGVLGPRLMAQTEVVVELRNGIALGPGIASDTDSITTNSFQQGGGASGAKSIGILDDGLRKTYFNKSPRNFLGFRESNLGSSEQIELPSAREVSRSGSTVRLQGVLGIDQFNKYGHRTFAFISSRGPVRVLQGITLLTPQYAKVEVLNTKTTDFIWDQRLALSSIPSDQLRAVLNQALDLTKANEWLRLYSFYVKAERFAEAREVMAEAIERFPTELGDRVGLLAQTDQQLANQMFQEINLRRAAGQVQMAAQLLNTFPVASLPLETQLKLREELTAIQQRLRQVSEIVQALREVAARLPEPDQQVVAGMIDEMVQNVNLDSVVKLVDFNVLRGDETLPAENLTALAVAGWILGPGSGVQNFAVTKSLIRVRGLVSEYLAEANEGRRAEILRLLQGEEGAQPELLAKLIRNLPPPLPLPETQPNEPSGLHRVSVKMPDGFEVQYLVQVPPEYDVQRKYPCIVMLPGDQGPLSTWIDYWCGVPMAQGDRQLRFGQATRHGYIVITPQWMGPTQSQYGYTEVEKQRVLVAMRDALRRLSVDTDRIFIAGHTEGGTAAWDLAQSHPGLWAGAVMISPGAGKYIPHYTGNVQATSRLPDEIPLATYIVYGELDPTRPESDVGNVGTTYLKSPLYDCMVVEYIGRGRERFLSETPRIMEWMELSSHRRVRNPGEISTKTMRPGDRSFYWLEAPQLSPQSYSNPYQIDASKSGVFEASLLDSTTNGVRISSLPSLNRMVTVWFNPEMVDFSRPVMVMFRGDRTRYDLAPDIAVMLEDVRTRADRQHFYWQKLTLP